MRRVYAHSTAGIYIPTLVQQIEKHPETKINLKGFAIGDGCIGACRHLPGRP